MMEELFEKLDRMKKYEKGWNSYCADPPSELAISSTKSFLNCMSKHNQVPQRVEPSSIGGVAITWRSSNYVVDKKKSYFEFHNGGRLFMMLTVHEEDGETIIKEVKDGNYVGCIREAANYIGITIP